MSRLKNLYTYLIANRSHEIQGWLTEYKAFTAEVKTVGNALRNGSDIKDASTYTGTRFQENDQPFQIFARHLIYERNNGISSRGQSVLSDDDFRSFLESDKFVTALAELIKNPSMGAFEAFAAAWQGEGKTSNPLLINRTLAACTLDVSTTVNRSNFETVFWWLVQEKLISAPSETPEKPGTWYSRNVHLMAALKEHFDKEMTQGNTDEHQISIFVWELFANRANPFSLKKQVVRYGPPGTGKTYTALQQVQLLFEMWKLEFAPAGLYEATQQIETIQFHPSYSYEDFMEGLRPDLDEDQKSHLCLKNGLFKNLCIRAAKWELDVLRLGLGEKIEWATLMISDLVPHKDKLKGSHWEFIFDQEDKTKKVSEAVPPHFLIIDEINRAELSRVLGELMFCLEYRGAKGAIKTQYAGLNDDKTGMLKMKDDTFQFFIPHSVFIIGTMNTIDRSIESFDFALRRRFRWEEVVPDENILEFYLGQNGMGDWAGLADNLRQLNQSISDEPLLGPDYRIGHAYLMNINYPRTLTLPEVRFNIWDDNIRPLLQEYVRGTGRTHELVVKFAGQFGVR